MNHDNVFPIFSKPLYFEDRELFKFNDEQLEFIKESEYFHAETNSISKSNQILESPKLSNLKKFVEYHIDRYTRRILDLENHDYRFEICSSWMTKTKKGQHHNFHIHNTSMISGIINVTPKNVTMFNREVRQPFPFFSFDYKDDDIKYSQRIHIRQDNPGCILMFPSDVRHAVASHELEDDRYSISFNVFPRGNFYVHPEQTIV
jgi:uncharacterized protein (TIGR02466 family)